MTMCKPVVLAVAAGFIVLALAPAPDQCDSPTFARANPQLCYVGFPFPQPAPTGGGGSGGILGTIGKILGGLTGGLL